MSVEARLLLLTAWDRLKAKEGLSAHVLSHRLGRAWSRLWALRVTYHHEVLALLTAHLEDASLDALVRERVAFVAALTVKLKLHQGRLLIARSSLRGIEHPTGLAFPILILYALVTYEQSNLSVFLSQSVISEFHLRGLGSEPAHQRLALSLKLLLGVCLKAKH